MSNLTYPLLKHLNSPVRILSFSINDLMAYALPIFIGSLFDSLVIIPFFGLLTIFFGKRLMRRFPKFYLIRLLYWTFPTGRYNRAMKIAFPSSNKRIWVK